jgi:hypothetical protein
MKTQNKIWWALLISVALGIGYAFATDRTITTLTPQTTDTTDYQLLERIAKGISQIASNEVSVTIGDINVSTNQTAAALEQGLGDYGTVMLSAPGGAVNSAPLVTFGYVFDEDDDVWYKMPGDTNGIFATVTNLVPYLEGLSNEVKSLRNTETPLPVSAILSWDPTNTIVISDGTNSAWVDPTTGALRVLVMNDTATNVWLVGGPGTNVSLASLPSAPAGTNSIQMLGSDVSASNPVFVQHVDGTNEVKQLGAWKLDPGTNSVGGFSVACTNSIAIATNEHTVGMAITSGEITNFFRVDGGSAMLQTLTWVQFSQTNADNKLFWPFSRPITAVTNAALWGPTEADMMFLCSAPITLGTATNEITPFGISGFAQYATSLARPMVNSWTNRELYYVITQGPVATAANTSNAVTTARVRVTGLQD